MRSAHASACPVQSHGNNFVSFLSQSTLTLYLPVAPPPWCYHQWHHWKTLLFQATSYHWKIFSLQYIWFHPSELCWLQLCAPFPHPVYISHPKTALCQLWATHAPVSGTGHLLSLAALPILGWLALLLPSNLHHFSMRGDHWSLSKMAPQALLTHWGCFVFLGTTVITWYYLCIHLLVVLHSYKIRHAL